MYEDYLKEREGLETLQTQAGFATYKVNHDECYLKDIYVKPEFRKSGVASSIADAVCEIARGRGCRWLVGSVSPEASNSHASMLTLIAYGMRLTKSDKDIVYFAKEI